MICKNCWVPMIGVVSFSKEKHERFCQCPRCKGETKHILIKDSNLNFREVLHMTMQNNL